MSARPVRVLKRDLAGRVTWQYDGRILAAAAGCVQVEAFFNRADMPFLDVVFKRGDRFIEWFYTGRWYNIFEVHDRDDGAIKGWYCNIGMPAVLEAEHRLSYVDLALDLWVSPAGLQTVLDTEEFARLDLAADVRSTALAALHELQGLFKLHRPPFA